MASPDVIRDPIRDPASCPPVDAQEEFAAGRVVGAGVMAHILACPACQAEVQRIRADNKFLSGLIEIERRLAAAPPVPSSPLPAPGPDFVPGYEILAQVYAGGQGVVYKARQNATRRSVAVKVLSHVHAASSPRVRRFEREIEVVAALRHPNIVTVFDSGVTTDGRLFFAMEYVDGRPLDAARQAGGSEVKPTLALFSKIAHAVSHAHRHGVIHRDLKPGNILIDGAGEPRVVDFGLAKLTREDLPSATLTVSGEFMGTLCYASPEQVSGHPDRVDIRADVYALGVILYEMLTGRLPYQVAGSLSDVVRTITEAQPQRPSTIARGIDGELEVIVLKALAKMPERRYQSAGALADDIDHYLSGAPIDARRDSTWYVFRKTLRRYRVPVSLASAAMVLVMGFAVLMTVQAHRIARERDRADASAAGLTRSLRESDFQRGRSLTAAGSFAAAEDLLWREFLNPPQGGSGGSVAGSSAAARVIDDAGSPHCFWALWELYAHMSCLATLAAHDGDARSVAFSPDGRTLASGGWDGMIRLWPLNGPRGREPLVLPAGGRVDQVAFAPHGRTLAGVRQDGALALWDVGLSPPRPEPLPAADPVVRVSFSPDGRILAVAPRDGGVALWDLETHVARYLPGVDREWNSVAFSPDGRLLVCGGSGGVEVWDVDEQEVIASIQEFPSPNPCFGPGGSFVVLSRLEQMFRWDAPFIEPPPSEGPDAGAWLAASAGIAPRAFHPRGHLLALGLSSNVVELWDVDAVHRTRTLPGHRDAVASVAFSPDGDVLASGSADGTIRMWDVAPQRADRLIKVFAQGVNAISFSPDGALLASADGRSSTVTLWDVRTCGENVKFAQAHDDSVIDVSYSPDGTLVASAGYDGRVRLWDAGTGRCVRTLSGDADEVHTVQFSPDGTLLACSARYDNVVSLWDAPSGECIAVLSEPTGRVPQVRFSPDGSRLAACGAELLIWDVASHRLVRRIGGLEMQVRAIAWSPDGRWLASGSDDPAIRLWDVGSGECRLTLEGHHQHLFALDFSPDGRYLASGDRGGEVRLWDVASGRHLLTLAGGTDEVAPDIFEVEFSPDGRTLAIASAEPSIRLWDLTYYARHIAGNLEYRIGRLPPDRRDPHRLAELRAWAERALFPANKPGP